MKTTTQAMVWGIFGVAVAMGQQPSTGYRALSVQAPQDPREADVLKACKTPPPARGGRGGGGGQGQARGPARAAAPAGPRDYKVTEIPGVIAAGAQWKEVWTVEGNNADGIIGTNDGGILIAQNDNSAIVKLYSDGTAEYAFFGTNTSGSVAMNKKGDLFTVNRGSNTTVEQLTPQRRILAKSFNGDPLDCIGGVINDVTADSHGGVYFTFGGLFHADATGKVTRYGENLNTNGIMLSADEKHLWVTNGQSLAEFDVQKDGSLTNQHEFAKLGGGGDGSTFDAAGRLYVTTTAPGVQVIGPDGKDLGTIPTPRGVISVAISGADHKTLYAVSRDNALNKDWIISIPLLAEAAKGRGK